MKLGNIQVGGQENIEMDWRCGDLDLFCRIVVSMKPVGPKPNIFHSVGREITLEENVENSLLLTDMCKYKFWFGQERWI